MSYTDGMFKNWLDKLIEAAPPLPRFTDRRDGSDHKCKVILYQYGGPNDGAIDELTLGDLDSLQIDDSSSRRLKNGPVIFIQYDHADGKTPVFHMRLRCYPEEPDRELKNEWE